MSIKLEISDWLYNAGVVGLVQILKHSGDSIKMKGNYVEFDEESLEGFEEKYFSYFADKYEKFTSWYKLVNFEETLDNYNLDNITEKDIENINDYIEDLKKKLTSNSYKSGYLIIEDQELDLLQEEKKLQKIKKGKKQEIADIKPQIQETIGQIKKIISYLRKEEVQRIIKAKNIIYDIIQQFWSDVSFLNKNNSKNDMFIEYKNYFLAPVIDYISSDKSKYKHSCYTCDSKISSISSAKDLTWLTKIGADMARKSSHFWNFNGIAYICPLCNLIYSCIPAGFNYVRGKGLFVNQNSSMKVLISVNEIVLNKGITFEDLEEQSYFNIADSMEQNNIQISDKEIENIQIVKLDSNNERRPYTFNLLSKEKLIIINKNAKRLKSLLKIHVKISKDYYINLYSEVLQRLYNNKNQFDLINELLSLNLQEKFRNLSAVYHIIHINNQFLGGGKEHKMVYYKDIDSFKDYGVKLREAYSLKNKNKLPGITYRLLNVLKTKDTSKFMDTLINAYLYLDKQIPVDFVNGLKDIEKFQTIGYSFLVGLQGDVSKNNKDGEDVKND